MTARRAGPPQPSKTLMRVRTTMSAWTATIRATQTRRRTTAKPQVEDRRASSDRRVRAGLGGVSSALALRRLECRLGSGKEVIGIRMNGVSR